MNTTKIKICGITRVEDAQLCAELGADYLGFIFVPTSARYLDAAQAAEIADAVRSSGAAAASAAETSQDERRNVPRFVGVFRDESLETIHYIAHRVGLDLIQFHGTETDDDIHALGLPSVKAYRVGETLPNTSAHPSADWLLFDTFDEKRDGGTGKQFDWSLLAMYSRSKPFFLAGGLAPDNIAAAISLVRPDGVDISSGVESEPGVKDPEKLRNLFERVRRP
ncbi:MAG TPA: phosphoribosylanthranilate isomerase [Thermoanaerobaculia bacterium]|nr:phosphoribosylanthranilate isomerase [Thermoanaerobaculia bacterium]